MLRVWTLLYFVLVSILHATDNSIPMEGKNKLEIVSTFFQIKFKQNGNFLTSDSLYQLLGQYPGSRRKVSASKDCLNVGSLFIVGGGIIIGSSIPVPGTNRKFNAPLFFSGLAASVTGGYLNSLSLKLLVRAVNSYNRELEKTSLRFELSPSQDGLVLSMSF